MRDSWGPNTTAAHAGGRPPRGIRAGAPPIYQSSVFTFDDLATVDAVFDGRQAGYSYSRVANPNNDQLASAVAQLEGVPTGEAAASGMAAVHAALRACLTADRRRIVAADDIYGGTYQLFEGVLRPEGLEVVYVPLVDHDRLRAAATPDTAVIYVESISNPLLRVAELDPLAEIAASCGAALVVDNTFASPYIFQPARHGADLIVHSATKFLGGHHDGLAGVVVGRPELVAKAAQYNTVTGATLDPFCAWLLLRGLRTLGLRLARASDNAAALAEHLRGRGQVTQVYYPGLAEHPDHRVAAAQFRRGFGPMLSFDLGCQAAAAAFVQGLRLIQFAPSLGGYDTTISHPVLTSHRGVPAERRAAMGVTGGLIRMSVGCEDLADLHADIDQALATGRG